MSETLIAAEAAEEVGTGPDAVRDPIVNDLTIHVATVNGSGSQSSNNVLMRSIFQMGVPVSGKNMFPSNIAGLPTSNNGLLSTRVAVDCRRSTAICRAS